MAMVIEFGQLEKADVFRVLFKQKDLLLMKRTLGVADHKRNTAFIIDPMHKWRQFKYSFIYIQTSPTSLILGNIFF